MRILMIVFAALFISNIARANNLVPPAEVAAWLEKHPDAVLVDVRTPKEYAEGHIEGAVLIDWSADEFTERVKAAVNLERPVLLICRSGRRSSEAAQAMEKIGFTRTADLRGGMIAWRKADLPIVIPES